MAILSLVLSAWCPTLSAQPCRHSNCSEWQHDLAALGCAPSVHLRCNGWAYLCARAGPHPCPMVCSFQKLLSMKNIIHRRDLSCIPISLWFLTSFLTSNTTSIQCKNKNPPIITYIKVRKHWETTNTGCEKLKLKTSTLIVNCKNMSSRYYLPMRHYALARKVWNRRAKKKATTKVGYIETDKF